MLSLLRHRRLSPWADVLLAGGLLVLGQWQVWGGWHDGGVGLPPDGDRPTRAVLVLVIGVALAWRRRRPLAVVLAICAAIACQLLAVVAFVPFLTALMPMAVSNYTAAAYARRWRVASLVLVLVVEGLIYVEIPEERATGEVLFATFVALGTWIVGDVVRSRAHRAQQILGDAHSLVAQSEAATRAALADERARIARELHDVIAHTVSVMGVQAGAARLQIDRDPEAARSALFEVEAAARSSVGELQRLLAVLRDDSPRHEELAPQPGLSRLDELVGQIRSAGLEVSVRATPGLRLPPGLDLTAFRIIQEALTNALKHAGAPTVVAVELEDGRLVVEVTNTGPSRRSQAPQASGARHGLLGMRERVQLYGGTLHAQPRADGGFTVRAELPFPAEMTLDPVS